jgi:hypothetical protein
VVFTCGFYWGRGNKARYKPSDAAALYADFIDDLFRTQLDACALCSFQQYAQQRGIRAAFKPLPPHDCPATISVFSFHR